MPLVVTSVMTKGILGYPNNEDIVKVPNTIHLYADSNIASRLLNSSYMPASLFRKQVGI